MMNQCNCSLRDYLSQRLDKALSDGSSACPENTELSLMGAAACNELLCAKDCCCTLAFMLYLCFCCKDVNGLVADLRKNVLDVYEKQSNAS